jgi:hypothetical protein
MTDFEATDPSKSASLEYNNGSRRKPFLRLYTVASYNRAPALLLSNLIEKDVLILM